MQDHETKDSMADPFAESYYRQGLYFVIFRTHVFFMME